VELVVAKPSTIVAIGEGMLELSAQGSQWRLGYGGDTLNTAIHLARAGHSVAYMTALGSDPFSERLRNVDWPHEGLDTSLILTDLQRGPGLYAITNDADGERSFTYWRENSAAQRMFGLPETDAAVEKAATADLIVYSLITLAILPQAGRDCLYKLCDAVRSLGGKVAFDGNYRPRLWENAAAARAARDAAIARADIGLPSLEDEAALSGEQTRDAVAAHWNSLGCAEVVVKDGAFGCRLPNGITSPPGAVLSPLDTSGAGDAFNGGYLSARMKGMLPEDAAAIGHRVAGWVVMQQGAIPSGWPATVYS